MSSDSQFPITCSDQNWHIFSRHVMNHAENPRVVCMVGRESVTLTCHIAFCLNFNSERKIAGRGPQLETSSRNNVLKWNAEWNISNFQAKSHLLQPL